MQAGEKVSNKPANVGWEILPCRGQEAPQSALLSRSHINVGSSTPLTSARSWARALRSVAH